MIGGLVAFGCADEIQSEILDFIRAEDSSSNRWDFLMEISSLMGFKNRNQHMPKSQTSEVLRSFRLSISNKIVPKNERRFIVRLLDLNRLTVDLSLRV